MDTICLVVVMIIPRILRMGRGGLGDHNTSPVTCEGSHLSACGEYTEHTAVMGDTNNQGSAEQNTSETQHTHGLQTTIPQGPLHQRQPREDGSEEEKGHQGDEIKVSSHPTVTATANLFTSTDARRTQHSKMPETKAAVLPVENLSAPEAGRAGQG